MLWVGERTRQLDHAHIHFVSGIGNPIGVKISDKASPEELLEVINAVNPDNIPGRITIIVRMGAEKLREKLPILIKAVQREGKQVARFSPESPEPGFDGKGLAGYLLPYAAGSLLAIALASAAFAYIVLGGG